MKSLIQPIRPLKIGVAISALALAATVSVHASARGGASGLLQPREMAAVPAIESTHAGACADCKEAFVIRRSGFKGAPMLIGRADLQAVHLCPACKTSWKTSGHGKAAIVTPMHLCPACRGAQGS
jgi:hypothetical protein